MLRVLTLPVVAWPPSSLLRRCSCHKDQRIGLQRLLHVVESRFREAASGRRGQPWTRDRYCGLQLRAGPGLRESGPGCGDARRMRSETLQGSQAPTRTSFLPPLCLRAASTRPTTHHGKCHFSHPALGQIPTHAEKWNENGSGRCEPPTCCSFPFPHGLNRGIPLTVVRSFPSQLRAQSGPPSTCCN